METIQQFLFFNWVNRIRNKLLYFCHYIFTATNDINSNEKVVKIKEADVNFRKFKNIVFNRNKNFNL